MYSYAEIKLSEAIYGLAVGEGNIRRRIAEVYLDILILNEKDFPEELVNDFKWIKKEITKKGAIKDYDNKTVIISSVHNTMSSIRNSTGSKIAKRIYHLYSRLQNINESINN